MSEEAVRKFIDGLEKLEGSHDAQAIAAAFGENCSVGNVLSQERFRGREGAQSFWTKYRDAFRDVKSTFRNVIVAGDRAALEWVSEGTGPEGEPFSYSGVTILEMDGDSVTGCRAYFDADYLGRQLSHPKKRQLATHT